MLKLRDTAVALSIACFAGVAPAHAAPALTKIAEADLPGPGGLRFDYLRVDAAGGRLFVTHLSANQIYVVGLNDLRVIGTIKGTPGVEDVAYVPELNRLYTSNWGENKIGVVDLTRMEVVERIATANKPDGIEYVSAVGKVYVSNERGKVESVIDVRTNKTIAEIKFDSETGVPRYDSVAGKLYVNLQDRSVIAVIDPTTDKITDRIPVPGCSGNHGMALDPEHHRMFLGCEGGSKLAVVDLDRGQVIATFDLPAGVDFVDYDPGLRRIYAACGAGAIAIVQQDDPDHYRRLEDLRAESVHTVVVDPSTHLVYATQEREGGRGIARLVVFQPTP